MATHSSTLAWRIPWTEEPDGLQSIGLPRVGHNWATNTVTFNQHSNDQLFLLWFHLISIQVLLPALSLCFFAPVSSLLANLLLIVHFHTMACGFTKMRQKNNIPAGVDFCVWTSNRCIVTNSRQTLKQWCDWSLTMMCICYSHNDLWTKELPAKFYFMQLLTINIEVKVLAT